MRIVIALALLAFALGFAQGDPWTGAELAYVGPDGRVYAGRTDGAEPVAVSALGERAQFPSWSPDRARLAAIVSDGRRGRLVAFDAPRAELELYAADGPRAPIYHAWSPTSDAVAVLANEPEVGLALHVADLDDTTETRRLAVGSPFYWDWTNDGRGLWIHSGFQGPGARFGPTAAREDTLDANFDAPGFFQAPDLSPSGAWVAYSAFAANGDRRVTLAPLGDGPQRQRRQLAHEGLVALAWSPTEDVLAFTAPEGPVARSIGPLQLLDARDGFLRPLVDAPVLAFFWSPDGRRIAFVTLVGDGPGGGGVARTAPGTIDAQRVQRGGLPLLQLSVVDVDVGDVRPLTVFSPTRQWLGQFLPFFDQYARSHRVWSPASDAIVLPMRDADGLPVVTVVGLDGAATVVGRGDMPFWR